MFAFTYVFPSVFGPSACCERVVDPEFLRELEDCVRVHTEQVAMLMSEETLYDIPRSPCGRLLRSFNNKALAAGVERMKDLATVRSVLNDRYAPDDTSGLYMLFRRYSDRGSTRFDGAYYIVHPTGCENMYLVDDRGYASLVRVYPQPVPLMVPPPAPSVPSACL
jgi:hypothetical protein